jgi:putative peptide zinc metalloprotease protein
MSSGTLYSAHWYRVGPLRPRIQPGTSIQRQILRGEEWFVFTHPVSGLHHRLNRNAYELAGRLDGEHTLDALWNGLQPVLGDDLPTQDEVIAMLSRMMDAGLVLFDTLPDWPALKQQKAKRAPRANLNPFAFSVRLLNPSVLLDKLAWLQPVVWHPATGILCALILAWGLSHALTEWNAISAYAKLNMLTPRFLLLSWLAYPFIKALHELAHALAVRHGGGQVKDAGIGLFMLMPAPYVDATAATAFPSKWQRAAVSSAGILVELTLAAVALSIWLMVEAGTVSDIAFVVMAIGGLSTIVFNANPLMRFDGYYILCDLLELPNLASRSQRWWMGRLRRLVEADGSADTDFKGSEQFWLFLYAPASWLYRIVISVAIVKWVAGMSPLLGMVAMAWLAFSIFVRPMWSVMSILLAPGHAVARRGRALLAAGGGTAALLVFLFLVPLPASTVAAGVVWVPEYSEVRTDSDGMLASLVAKDGQQVAKGQPLAIIDSPALLARRATLAAKIMGAETEQADGWRDEALKGRNASEELARLRTEMAQVEEQVEKLTLRAGVDGVFVFPHVEDVLGRYLLKGTLVAYVLPRDPAMVRVAVSQDDIGSIKGGIRHLSVRLAEAEGHDFSGRLLRVDPASTSRLPSAAMGDHGGGALVTDPVDRDGLTLREPVFLVDVQLPERAVRRTGGRAWVRFEHESRPLAETAMLRFRQLFLKTFAGEGA